MGSQACGEEETMVRPRVLLGALCVMVAVFGSQEGDVGALPGGLAKLDQLEAPVGIEEGIYKLALGKFQDVKEDIGAIDKLEKSFKLAADIKKEKYNSANVNLETVSQTYAEAAAKAAKLYNEDRRLRAEILHLQFKAGTLESQLVNTEIKVGGDLAVLDATTGLANGFQFTDAQKKVLAKYGVDAAGITAVESTVTKKQAEFKFTPEQVDELKKKGLDAVSLKNAEEKMEQHLQLSKAGQVPIEQSEARRLSETQDVEELQHESDQVLKELETAIKRAGEKHPNEARMLAETKDEPTASKHEKKVREILDSDIEELAAMMTQEKKADEKLSDANLQLQTLGPKVQTAAAEVKADKEQEETVEDAKIVLQKQIKKALDKAKQLQPARDALHHAMTLVEGAKQASDAARKHKVEVEKQIKEAEEKVGCAEADITTAQSEYEKVLLKYHIMPEDLQPNGLSQADKTIKELSRMVSDSQSSVVDMKLKYTGLSEAMVDANKEIVRMEQDYKLQPKSRELFQQLKDGAKAQKQAKKTEAGKHDKMQALSLKLRQTRDELRQAEIDAALVDLVKDQKLQKAEATLVAMAHLKAMAAVEAAASRHGILNALKNTQLKIEHAGVSSDTAMKAATRHLDKTVKKLDLTKLLQALKGRVATRKEVAKKHAEKSKKVEPVSEVEQKANFVHMPHSEFEKMANQRQHLLKQKKVIMPTGTETIDKAPKFTPPTAAWGM